MTTPGNNGANTPEDDDPFGYLYEDGQAARRQPAPHRWRLRLPGSDGGAAQPGVPRTSYNQVRTVGERKYGPIPHQQQYQGPPQQYRAPASAAAYGQPTAQYAAPETYPGGAPPRQGPPPQQNGGGGRGPNTKGLLDRRGRGRRGRRHRHRGRAGQQQRRQEQEGRRRQARQLLVRPALDAQHQPLAVGLRPGAAAQGRRGDADPRRLRAGRHQRAGRQGHRRRVRRQLQQRGRLGHLEAQCARRPARTS